MRYATFALLLLPLSTQAQNGIAPAWDVRSTINQLLDQTARYESVADQLHIPQWIERGASETYRQQRDSLKAEAGYLKLVTTRLADQPEKLSLALDAYFRLQSIEGVTLALAEGAVRYEEPQIADALQKLVVENASTRSRLRQYVMDLSATKEQEYAIAEREAQRCQAELNRNPLAPAPPVYKPSGKKK